MENPAVVAQVSGTFGVDGASLAYSECGRGETVLLIHGSNSDLRTWRTIQGGLCRHHHVVAYSRRFHWPNVPIAAGVDYAMEEQANDVREILQQLELQRVTLIGHSYGAFLCLLAAMQHPTPVGRLVLVEPPVMSLFVSSKPTPGEMARLFATRPALGFAVAKLGTLGMLPAAAALRRNDLDAAMRHVGKAVLGASAFRGLDAQRLAQARQNTIPAEILGSGFVRLDIERIRQLSCPTLLIRGKDSPKLFRLLNAELSELLPDVQEVVVPGASHLVHEDNPEGWLQAVLTFTQKAP